MRKFRGQFSYHSVCPYLYMLLIKNIFQVRYQYHTAQLIPAMDEMISKLKSYLHFLAEQHITTLVTDDALRSYAKFNILTKKNKKKKDKLSMITEADIFGEATITQDLGAALDQYIAEVKKKATTEIITYWSQHKKVYPSLALMSKCYLSIPATNAPLECVFSQSKTIIAPQRHSLSFSLIERLVYIKDWF
ncbi:uncharacterized protein VP01_4037g2 [Puccinia sorghi]|uniref:HAT C-terminal dimerisation domain-containing protein n=1 Tax=Puccinia sorghi TaxID=27349 RepID=A0A0L6URT4_9BASI|nr:uncharacterized protein VP01_4037g2 [Puccinia sorghi]